ncbi:hypothetical protein IFM89_021951 [Coptis chinensis]|uniref:Sister chromatid cohesion 1 protein 3 n=1 Tax=Coptis chinensis TaxID=261450 RepID=A0A835LSG2_9MAGN|nr:hypothetical protein IFM89_021951 [Coptis chinensis]
MFYSHAFLARKTPLGTVWIAAHLQKLRKPLVSAAVIPDIVEKIMFPEVPIALRLSAHLLLGVVRIYSKKVEFLLQDCNEFRNYVVTAFAALQEINLPEEAMCAPSNTITLPENFDLDNFDLDDGSYNEGVQDNHLRTIEEITMTDQIPGDVDPYIPIFLDGEIRMDVSSPGEIPDAGVEPMDEDVPTNHAGSGQGLSDHVPVDQGEDLNQNETFQDFPEIETMLNDPRRDYGSDNYHDLMDDISGPSNRNIIEKENLTPIMEDGRDAEVHSLPPRIDTDPLSFGALAQSLNNFVPSASLGEKPSHYHKHSCPTPSVEKKKANPRKRKLFFDTSVVLLNEFIREGLNNTSGLVRRQKNLPCSALDVWKYKKRARKEQIFLDSSISGLCPDLQDIFRKEISKAHTVPVEDTHVEATVPVDDTHVEVTVPVDNTVPIDDTHVETRGANSPVSMVEIEHPLFERGNDYGSPFRGDDFTPFSGGNIDTEPGTTILDTEPLPSLDRTTPSLSIASEMETPMTHLEQQSHLERSGLSDIPERSNSTEGEHGRMENEVGTSSQVHTLSVRTRAVAQYLKDQSPTTEGSKGPLEKLILNKILEGKTRRKCARMFFETLVLKSHGLIDVEQEEAYGDITLLLAPLSNATF